MRDDTAQTTLPEVVDVLQFAIGEHAFVIDGVQVAQVYPRNTQPGDELRTSIDAAELLGLEPARRDRERSWIRIDGAGESFLLKLDDQVVIRRLERRLFRRLPAAIAGMGQASGVIGTVEMHEGFAFVVDPELLLSVHRNQT